MILAFPANALAQDTLTTKELEEITISGQREHRSIERLGDIENTYIWSGKKNEVISLSNTNANIAEKTARQIFAKVPGVFVYDMDGSGNQINISTRGLDPHRGWEFNIRRNGSLTNSDMYGYPASHYSMPMEAVDRVQLVRGTGSLQYGAQFGGMLNYVTKSPDSTKGVSFETINTIGSFALLSTYNSINGTIGKFQYYIYYAKRKSDGYRDNSSSDYNAQSLMLVYKPNKNLKVVGELSRSNYIYQIPGPLTDSMFHANPRHSTRARNYFNPEIYVPSVFAELALSPKTKLELRTSAVLGARNSVQFDRPANIMDVIDPMTNQYASRQVDIDHFKSFTNEIRVLHNFTLLNKTNNLAAGVQFMNNDLHRQQLGEGTPGTDFDLTLSQPEWGRDLHFKTKNVAIFFEDNIKINQHLSLNPGVRVEVGSSDMFGTITYYNQGDIPNTIRHQFPLFGLNAQYNLGQSKLYAGWAQAYRPVIFKDIIPGSLYEAVNKDLKDASGYNFELGYRGSVRTFRWDVSTFQLDYTNRMGTQALKDANGNLVLYRTNIGDSRTRGLEVFGENLFSISRAVNLTVFTSTSFMRAEYKTGRIRVGESNQDINGNKVESVPDVISRNGITVQISKFSATILYSFTAESFADPLNTVTPSSNGAVGVVPSYGILDFNAAFRVNDNVTFRFNVNNVTDKSYFTKRPTFYPGPGIWTSDGRSVNVSIGIKI